MCVTLEVKSAVPVPCLALIMQQFWLARSATVCCLVHLAESVASRGLVFTEVCEAMDPDILQIALAAPCDREGQGRRGATPEVLQRARAASAKSRASRSSPQVSVEGAKLAALCIPGCAPLLGELDTKGSRDKGAKELPISAMSRLAVSPKVRGSGSAVEKVRRLQNLSCALVATSALRLQRLGLDRWLRSGPAPGTQLRVIGFSLSWDEASQKLRALLEHAGCDKSSAMATLQPTSQKDVQVMVVLGTMHLSFIKSRAGHTEVLSEWQPWLAAPMFLSSTGAQHILEGLARAGPVDMTDPEVLKEWVRRQKDIILGTYCFDFASSNVACFRTLAASVEALGASPVLVHGERCATHCVHLVKAHCIATSSLAGMLYSVSKLVGASRTVDGMVRGVALHVRQALEIRYGEPPPADELLDALLSLMGLDEDLSLVHRGGSRSGAFTTWYDSVRKMCERSLFDTSSGKWLYYAPTGSMTDPAVVKREAEDFIATPLCEVLVQRRWETAALSRWTGVMHCLKRMTVGIVMNGVLVDVLASLSSRLGVTEAKYQKELERNKEQATAGQEVDDTAAKNMSRMLRVSTFFKEKSRQWQTGVTLIAVSVVDKLHWAILGPRGARQKANLTAMVDPHCSIVGEAMTSLADLSDAWAPEQKWGMLKWLRLDDSSPAASLATHWCVCRRAFSRGRRSASPRGPTSSNGSFRQGSLLG